MQRKDDLLTELYRTRDIFAVLLEREQVKAEIARCSASIFQILAQPFFRLCEDFVSLLKYKVDRAGYFTHPVPLDLFPDYPSVVQYPMDFSTILKNIAADRTAPAASSPDMLFYPTLGHLYADLKLIPENSRLYNTSTSVFYLAADRLEVCMKRSFEELHRKLSGYRVTSPFDSLNLEANSQDYNKFDWDQFIQKLPQPTPARFLKPSPKPVIKPSTLTSLASSGSSTISSASIKRRGRPPKNRDSLPSSLSSISSSSSSSASSSTDSMPKKRGRPRKSMPVVLESDEDEQGAASAEKVQQSKRTKSERKVCWIETSEGVWWPARVVDPNDPVEVVPNNLKRLRSRAAAVSWLCQAFDSERQWLWVAKEDAEELTADLEADLERLEYAPRNRKQIANAYRAALEGLEFI